MDSMFYHMDIDKRKGYIGALMGILIFVICCTWYNFLVGALFAVLFTLSGFIRINVHSLKSLIAVNVLVCFCVIVATWVSSMAMLNVVGRMSISFNRLVLNFVCIVIVCFFFVIITADLRTAVIIGTLLLTLLCLANGIIFQFRGRELAPLDFLSIKTAVNVAGQYSLKLSPSMFYGLIVWFFSVFVQFSVPKLPKFSKLRIRMVCLAFEFILVIGLFMTTNNIKIRLWDSQGTRINGYFLNFFLELRHSSVDKPNNYSPDRVKDIFEKHTQLPEVIPPVNTEIAKEEEIVLPADEEQASEYPNIIVIMDESFADFSVLGDNFFTDMPVTPFMDSLTENTIRGYALTSVYGGNTANSEFEFLTSHSMRFLPENSVPYQQYIDDEIHSLPWMLRSYGYKCASTHPYHDTGWSRRLVYPLLGFQDSTFLGNYIMPELVREYVSDRQTFEYILNYLEYYDNDKPLFMFGITMQNHGGYNYEGTDFVSSIKLLGLENEYPEVEQYLTLINKTDQALEYLITELEDYPEDTIVLFFGDHFPSLNRNFYEEVHGGPLETLEEKMLLYKVPFFIWANYDIPEIADDFTSLNYLSVKLLEVAGFRLSPFYEMINECKKIIPAFNTLGMYSVANSAIVPFSEASPFENDWLEEYSVLQYNNLIDSKNRDDNLKPTAIIDYSATD